jgi:heat shock protein HslJ
VTDAGKTTTVPDPTKYTIIFNTDGTITGQADCNSFTGAWSQAAGGFTIKLGASTMAFCGEASLDQQYLTLLSNVAAGGPEARARLRRPTARSACVQEWRPRRTSD